VTFMYIFLQKKATSSKTIMFEAKLFNNDCNFRSKTIHIILWQNYSKSYHNSENYESITFDILGGNSHLQIEAQNQTCMHPGTLKIFNCNHKQLVVPSFHI